MSETPTAVRALAFGDADGSLWGAVVARGSAALLLGSPDAGAPLGLGDGLRWSEHDGGVWELAGDGVALTITPVPLALAPPEDGEDAQAGEGGGPQDDAPTPVPVAVAAGAPELCRVQGTVTLGGELALDCPGVRIDAVAPRSAKAAPVSARLVGAWFAGGAAAGLLAERPGRGARHDADAVSATLFDPGGLIPVADPRLSTTYDGSGTPARTNLELWIGTGEREFPRRVAGEAAGAAAAQSAEGLSLQAVPLRCHSRGEDGAGVYALATFA